MKVKDPVNAMTPAFVCLFLRLFVTAVSMHTCVFVFLSMFQWNVFQYPFQRRVIKAVQFLRETGRKVIEVRKNAINKGEEVPDDILQHIIQQQGLLSFTC